MRLLRTSSRTARLYPTCAPQPHSTPNEFDACYIRKTAPRLWGTCFSVETSLTKPSKSFCFGEVLHRAAHARPGLALACTCPKWSSFGCPRPEFMMLNIQGLQRPYLYDFMWAYVVHMSRVSASEHPQFTVFWGFVCWAVVAQAPCLSAELGRPGVEMLWMNSEWANGQPPKHLKVCGWWVRTRMHVCCREKWPQWLPVGPIYGPVTHLHQWCNPSPHLPWPLDRARGYARVRRLPDLWCLGRAGPRLLRSLGRTKINSLWSSLINLVTSTS